MSQLFIRIVNMSITASWLILAVIIARWLLKKAPKWIVCLLWVLIAFRLVCPLSIESIFSLIPAKETVPATIEMDASPRIDSGITIVNEAVNSVLEESFTPDPINSANPLQIVLPILSLIWIIGAASLLLYALISYLILRKKVSASVPIQKDPSVYACDEIKAPFLLGLFKPVIYIPSSLDERSLPYVIDHEIAHIKRRDHWWKPFGYLLLAVYWFNPLCWLAYVLLCRDIEAACDEKVIQTMDQAHIASYSQALLDCSFQRRAITACPLAFGEVGVKERIKGILSYKKPAFWIILAALVVCIVIAVFLGTDPVSSRSLSDKLAFSMEQAILEHNHSKDTDSAYPVADYEVLGVSRSKGAVTVYAKVLYEEYVCENGIVYDRSGSSIPCAVSFDTSSEGDVYPVLEYWEPRDGTYYPGDIRAKFPLLLQRKAFDVSGSEAQHERNQKKAEEHFRNSPEVHILRAVITEIREGTLLVTPVEGSWELSSADSFSVPIQNMPSSPEPRVGDTVEIEHDGYILEIYPASFGEVYSVKVVEQGPPKVMTSIVARVAYANWSDDERIVAECLNAGSLLLSNVRHLPVFKFDSKAELDEFKETFGGIFTLDQGYNEVSSFNDASAAYDEAFFSDRSLILAYIESSSGSFRYEIQNIMVDGTLLTLDVVQTNNPETVTADMAGWFVWIEISDADLTGYSDFDARLVGTWEAREPDRLPGMIEFGSFSFEEVKADLDLTSPGVKTEGFVNTEAVEAMNPVERAKAEVTVVYNLIQTFYDESEDVWMVHFFSSGNAGGDETVYLDGNGITLLVVYGE